MLKSYRPSDSSPRGATTSSAVTAPEGTVTSPAAAQPSALSSVSRAWSARSQSRLQQHQEQVAELSQSVEEMVICCSIALEESFQLVQRAVGEKHTVRALRQKERQLLDMTMGLHGFHLPDDTFLDVDSEYDTKELEWTDALGQLQVRLISVLEMLPQVLQSVAAISVSSAGESHLKQVIGVLQDRFQSPLKETPYQQYTSSSFLSFQSPTGVSPPPPAPLEGFSPEPSQHQRHHASPTKPQPQQPPALDLEVALKSDDADTVYSHDANSIGIAQEKAAETPIQMMKSLRRRGDTNECCNCDCHHPSSESDQRAKTVRTVVEASVQCDEEEQYFGEDTLAAAGVADGDEDESTSPVGVIKKVRFALGKRDKKGRGMLANKRTAPSDTQRRESEEEEEGKEKEEAPSSAPTALAVVGEESEDQQEDASPCAMELPLGELEQLLIYLESYKRHKQFSLALSEQVESLKLELAERQQRIDELSALNVSLKKELAVSRAVANDESFKVTQLGRKLRQLRRTASTGSSAVSSSDEEHCYSSSRTARMIAHSNAGSGRSSVARSSAPSASPPLDSSIANTSADERERSASFELDTHHTDDHPPQRQPSLASATTKESSAQTPGGALNGYIL